MSSFMDGTATAAHSQAAMSTTYEDYQLEDDAGALMSYAERLFSSFNPAAKTVDTHVEECFREWRIQSKDVQTFLSHILYGCVRFRKFVAVFVSSLYHNQSGNVLRNDRDMYHTFAYLALLRLKDISFAQFRRLVLVKDAQKMLVFLKYIFNRANLEELCKDEWMKMYDVQFVDSVVDGVLTFKDQAEDLINHLEEKVFMSARKKEEEAAAWNLFGQGAKMTTVPRPFNLTAPKPKAQPFEEPSYEQLKAKPAPAIRQGKTSIDVAIERAKERNREAKAEKYKHSRAFKPRVMARPSRFERVLREVREKEESLLNFDGIKPRPVPKIPDVQVKLNVSSLLRENALYQKQIEEEKRKAESFEQELRDSSEFDEWQARMRRIDEEERRQEIERRRHEMTLIAARAVKAGEERIRKNRTQAHGLQQLLQKLGNQHKEDLAQIKLGNEQSRARVMEDRKRVAESRQRLAESRMQVAFAIKSDQATHAEKIEEWHDEELREKQRRIRLAKEQKQLLTEKQSSYDRNKTADQGLLNEMSFAELQERLKREKEATAADEKAKRSKIRLIKLEREQKLGSLLNENAHFRKITYAQGAARRTMKVSKENESIARETEKLHRSMMNAYSRLTEKQKLRKDANIALKKEEQAIRRQQQSQAATKGAVEEKKFRELTAGAEREIKFRQMQKKKEALVYEATKAKENRIKMTHVQKEKQHKQERLEAYDAYVKHLTDLKTAELDKINKEKQMKASIIREFEMEQRSRLSSRSRSQLSSRSTLRPLSRPSAL